MNINLGVLQLMDSEVVKDKTTEFALSPASSWRWIPTDGRSWQSIAISGKRFGKLKSWGPVEDGPEEPTQGEPVNRDSRECQHNT